MSSRSVLKAAALVMAISVLIIVTRVLPVASWLEAVVAWTSGLGLWGIATLVAVYMVAAVLFVPGSLLTLGAGAVFGLAWGTLAASLGGTLGAGAAFLTGRHVARSRVVRWLGSNPRFASIDTAVASEGGKIVLLTRLSPIFPYNLLNYLFGLTKVGFWKFLLASWAGMLPATFLYVYAGFAGRVAAQTAAGEPPVEGGTLILWGVGLAATAALSYYLTRMARRTLRGHSA